MRQIVILGKGPSHKLCPFPDGSEIWGINDCYMNTPKRLDRIYQFKDVSRRLEVGDVKDLLAAQKQYGFKIFTATVPTHPELKSTLFPIREICEKFNTKFFANTFCYMIAHALYEGVDRIDLYGVDMRGAHEYIRELPCMNYWLGRAHGMGVQVTNQMFSAVGKYPLPTLYGDWFDTVRDIEGKAYG